MGRDCGHAGSSCVVGNFWQCKQPGCVNGPAAAPLEPVWWVEQIWLPRQAAEGEQITARLGGRGNSVTATALMLPNFGLAWRLAAGPRTALRDQNDVCLPGFELVHWRALEEDNP